MKWHLIITFILIFISSIAYNQVNKYRAFEFGYKVKEKPFIWSDVDLLVVIDGTKKKVKIYNKKQQDFDILFSNEENEHDEKYKADLAYFTVIDEDGVKCTMTLIKYMEPKKNCVMALLITYKGYDYAYRLKADD